MIVIDGIEFDKKIGEVLLPERDAIAFRSSYNNGTGVQLTGRRGPGFTLTLHRFDAADSVQLARNAIRARIGARVAIVEYFHNVRISYAEPVHGNNFFVVTQARVIQTRNRVAWHGHRLGTKIDHTPAIEVISQWTMYAVSPQ